MQNYTVLILRPYSLTSDPFLAHVRAVSAEQAGVFGQIEAWDNDNKGDEFADPADHYDYHVLFVCIGHQRNLSERMP